MDKSVRTWIEVSKSSLRHNVDQLKHGLGSGTEFMAVVKSNAYGHGIPNVVKVVDSRVDWFGVDSLPEAEEVRRAGSRKPVLILGYVTREARSQAVRKGFSQVIYDKESLDEIAAAATRRVPAKVHVKIETGTSRQGVLSKDFASFLRYAKSKPNIRLEGLSTHYANIEDTNDSRYAMGQLKRFSAAVESAWSIGFNPKCLHTACSAAILMYPETHFNLVRGGVSMYGLWSSGVTRRAVLDAGHAVELKPAMTWKTIVAQVKKLPKGTPISYGLTEKVTRDTRIAVIPVGYWDGFDRKLSSVGSVLIRGRRAKVLGRICMNMCVVDITDIRGVHTEDEVVLLGEQGKDMITAEELADRIGTINYEVVTRVNPISPRISVK
jgi:alanine racemase